MHVFSCLCLFVDEILKGLIFPNPSIETCHITNAAQPQLKWTAKISEMIKIGKVAKYGTLPGFLLSILFHGPQMNFFS